jgi:beta-galactosidase/beta-glucuronidase
LLQSSIIPNGADVQQVVVRGVWVLQITISEDLHGEEVASVMGKVGEKTIISIPKPKLWSPDSPHLYQVFTPLSSLHIIRT